MIFWMRLLKRPSLWGKREEVTGRAKTRLLPQLINTVKEYVMVRAVDWPCELLERVKTLWAQGLTAIEISEVVNKSRNAIIGKLNRARRNEAKAGLSEIQNRTTSPKKKVKPVKKIVAPAVSRGVTNGRGKRPSVPPIAVASPPIPPPLPVTAEWDGIALEVYSIQPNQCRYPLGEPVSGFCRSPLNGSRSSYCEYHHLLTTKKPDKRAGE